MTKGQLKVRVLLVVLYLFILIILANVDKLLWYGHVHAAVKDFSGLLIAAAAAYLSYCFSRRQAHLTSLRELWKQAVTAKGELIQYTHLEEFTRERFGSAHSAISSTIDQVRCVYKNVGETDSRIGYFPFEPLHDMRRCLESVGFAGVTPTACAEQRAKMIVAWNAFRCAFLKEFQTPEPPHPIIERDASDRRRNPKNSN